MVRSLEEVCKDLLFEENAALNAHRNLEDILQETVVQVGMRRLGWPPNPIKSF